jgi:CPA2 family monovalent cation:H+ antiporter-2
MNDYIQIAACFAAIALSAFLAEKTKLFFAPFYIVAGILIGPEVLGVVTSTHIIELMGEVGVVFLLLFLGLEFSLHTFLGNKKAVLAAGAIDFAVNFGIGFAVGQLLGLSVLMSLVVAGTIYMSSSGIVTKSLVEMNLSRHPEGNLIMGIMVFEDLVMIVFLVLVSAWMNGAGTLSAGSLALDIGKAAGFCAALILLARFKPPFLDKILGFKRRELLMVTFFGIVLLVTALGELAGVSKALSAFFLGVVFSRMKNVRNIESVTVTFRDIFGSVFFFSFGTALELGSLLSYLDVLLICVAAAIAGKIISSVIITLALKRDRAMSLFIAFITIPRGEFSLLISKMSSKAIPFIGPAMVVLAFVTTVVSALVLRVSKALCKIYNICIIFPRSRLEADNTGDWGEID